MMMMSAVSNRYVASSLTRYVRLAANCRLHISLSSLINSIKEEPVFFVTASLRPRLLTISPGHGFRPCRRNLSTNSAGDDSSTDASRLKKPEAPSSPAESHYQEGKSGESQQANAQPRELRGSPVSWLSLLFLVATGAGVLYYYDKGKKRHIEGIQKAGDVVREGPSVGKASIGGAFDLVNHEGKRVTEKEFVGGWTLMYFGFTHCPDICPDELQKIASAVDKIKEKSGIDIRPVFVSVDPERDTVEQVREYVKEFHPNLIGLTGSSDEIRKTARSYRVYYMKTSEEGDDYLVDHSIITYLMDPSMEFVKYFGKNNDVDALADSIIAEIKKYKKQP